jgi:HSP20 family molecular chaperone IbpA
MLEKNLTLNQNKDLAREETRAHEHYLAPAVDIFETESGLTLVADVPGLKREDLSIDIDQGLLTLKGTSERSGIENRLFEEFSVAGYYRQFRLPDSIDPDQTEAELKDGVLTLKLPKAEAAKPKKIAIKTIH